MTSEPNQEHGRPEGSEDYVVGYGKPPKETRFKPGNQAARKKGRPKGVRNRATILKSINDYKVDVSLPDGTRRKMPLWEASAWKQAVKAASGDTKAWIGHNRLCAEYGVELPNANSAEAEEVAPDEHEAIEGYFVAWALANPERVVVLLRDHGLVAASPPVSPRRSNVRVVDFTGTGSRSTAPAGPRKEQA